MTFYQTLFGWTLTPLQSDYMLFRSPDGISGAFRELDAVSPLDIPTIQIEVSDFAPLIDLATRCHGGYIGYVDPLLGEWTVNLRDPDGNLIRLVRPEVQEEIEPSAVSDDVPLGSMLPQASIDEEYMPETESLAIGSMVRRHSAETNGGLAAVRLAVSSKRNGKNGFAHQTVSQRPYLPDALGVSIERKPGEKNGHNHD